jgi:hypothetical protein
MNKMKTAAGLVIITVSTILPIQNIAPAIAAGRIESPVMMQQMTKFVDQAKVNYSLPQIAPLVSSVATGNVGSLAGFTDVTPKHWAAPYIKQGVEAGFVSGYPDGTFRPEKSVSRAEFIKLIVTAMNYNVDGIKTGGKWYDGVVNSAIQNGLITAKEYTSGTYDTTMTRLEMSKVITRSVGKTATKDGEYVLAAVQAGLLNGKDTGLDLQGATTRAQSVTVIDRVLRTLKGEVLPVDAKAEQLAKDELNIEYDAWGNKIRKTNLPKNASQFHYILEEVPNAAYELKYGFGDITFDPSEVDVPKVLLNLGDLTKANLDGIKQSVEGYYNTLLNLDYKNVNNDSWAITLRSYQSNERTSSAAQQTSLQRAKDYVQWAKDNKLITKGKVEAYPSMLWSDGTPYIRVYFEFSVQSGPITFDFDNLDNSTFMGQTSSFPGFYTGYKLGTVLKGYSDIKLNGDKVYGNLFTFKVSRSADLSLNYVMTK